MADVDTKPSGLGGESPQTTRADRFDRADFAARPLRTSQNRETTGQPPLFAVDTLAPFQSPATRPVAVLTGPPSNMAPAGGSTASDARLAADHLSGLGWSQAKIQEILGGPDPEDTPNDAAKPEDPIAQAGAYLRSLGWTESDIARLLVGPEKSHLTAEALFSQHAANSAADQETLLKALAQAGAQNIKPDPSLLSGLNPAHLNPETPSDLAQLISQFAELPDVQKQRFLLLLGSQKPSKQTATPKPEVAKSSGAGDVLPIVKSSLDLLSTALKDLLGTDARFAQRNDAAALLKRLGG